MCIALIQPHRLTGRKTPTYLLTPLAKYLSASQKAFSVCLVVLTF